MEELTNKKLPIMIAIMRSNRRERLFRYGDWRLTSESLFKEVFNLDNWTILEKDKRLVCFTISHEEGCEGQFLCSCTKTVADPRITVYYLSDLFTQMISVSHFQLYFSGNWRTPNLLWDIIDGIKVSSKHLKLFDIGEEENDHLHEIDQEHSVNDDEEFEKEESPDFQRMLDEFKTLICEYVKLAFTDPTSLPPFLLNSEGPTMPLSKLIAWLEESK
jgi:hypothetical protein